MNNKLINKNLEKIMCNWWLRSASSDVSYIVGYVDNDGYVHNYDACYNFGVAAVCLII